MSAATSVRLFLWSVIIGSVLAIVGAGLTYQWWTERQKRHRHQENLEQAHNYALLSGQAPQQPTVSIDALAQALQTTRRQYANPLAKFLPHDEGGNWKVL